MWAGVCTCVQQSRPGGDVDFLQQLQRLRVKETDGRALGERHPHAAARARHVRHADHRVRDGPRTSAMSEKEKERKNNHLVIDGWQFVICVTRNISNTERLALSPGLSGIILWTWRIEASEPVFQKLFWSFSV